MDRYAQLSDIKKLEARVKALESAQILQQQSAAPAVKSLTVQTVTDDALSDLYFAQPLGHKGSLRAVYDLGHQHGAFANSKPTPNDRQIGSSADTGLLPMIVSETGSDDEPEIERIICSEISGGADYVNGMPRELSLERIRDGDSISARYVQAPLEVAGPTPAPAGGLVEMLADVWSEGKPLHPAARRAAIRKVAEWLEQQQEVPIGSTASADYFAAMLRSEANR